MLNIFVLEDNFIQQGRIEAAIGQASRISGVNPADISILMVYIEGKGRSIAKQK